MKELFRLLRYAKPYSPALVASVFFMAIVGLSQGLLLKLIPSIFDRVLKPNSADAPVILINLQHPHIHLTLNDVIPSFLHVHNIWTMVASGIVACFFAKGVSDYIGNYLINWTGLGAIMDLRQEVFGRVLHQDAQFFENNESGRIMSALMMDIDRIQVSVSTMLADWLRQIFTAMFLLIGMISIDWKLSLIALLVFPVVALLTVGMGRRIRHSTRHAQDMAAGLTQILHETITGHQVVKSFGAEDFESKRFSLAAQRLRKGNLRYVAHQALSSPIIEIFGALTFILLLNFARSQAKNATITPGDFITFVLALLMLYEPIKRLTNIHNIFQQGLGAAGTVFRYLDTQPDVIDYATAVKMPKFEKGIKFENVRFCYPGAPDRVVLNNVNLDVRQGEVVALVGSSGAGKTTLANLVPRFYDVTSGTVQIDGRDVRDLKLSSLREKISIVAQETFLFNDTVFDNIAYGKPNARRDEVIAAAKAALAHEFIDRLPDGYKTLIGERGVKLSGGQRQRLAIARALLKDAPILILDEATSHLDSESERLVQQALTVLMKKRTVLVIAHRFSTIRAANKIVVLDNGNIAETGTHDQLLAAKGLYARLHDLQHADSSVIAG